MYCVRVHRELAIPSQSDVIARVLVRTLRLNGVVDPVHVEPDAVADQHCVASVLPHAPSASAGVLGGEGVLTTVSDERTRFRTCRELVLIPGSQHRYSIQ